MNHINISDVISDDQFLTLEQAERVLAQVDSETEIIDFRGLKEGMSSPIHHLMIKICISPDLGWDKFEKIEFRVDVRDEVLRAKVKDAAGYVEDLYGKNKV